jgi:hypothetical protein
MTFEFPEGLAPEVYPLAWLVGRWRGEGVIAYPGIEESAFVNEITVDHDGGPYLRYTSTLRLADADPSAPAWSTETGYWRIASTRPEGLGDGQHPVEVLLADPAGRVSVYVGAVGNGRIDLASDLIARTATAAEVGASKRLFGLVEGELLWVWELAAFGHPLQSYASAKLARVTG